MQMSGDWLADPPVEPEHPDAACKPYPDSLLLACPGLDALLYLIDGLTHQLNGLCAVSALIVRGILQLGSSVLERLQRGFHVWLPSSLRQCDAHQPRCSSPRGGSWRQYGAKTVDAVVP